MIDLIRTILRTLMIGGGYELPRRHRDGGQHSSQLYRDVSGVSHDDAEAVRQIPKRARASQLRDADVLSRDDQHVQIAARQQARPSHQGQQSRHAVIVSDDKH